MSEVARRTSTFRSIDTSAFLTANFGFRGICDIPPTPDFHWRRCLGVPQRGPFRRGQFSSGSAQGDPSRQRSGAGAEPVRKQCSTSAEARGEYQGSTMKVKRCRTRRVAGECQESHSTSAAPGPVQYQCSASVVLAQEQQVHDQCGTRVTPAQCQSSASALRLQCQ